MKDIRVLGIDLAKNVFQLHGTDAKGHCILRKRLTRPKLIEFVSRLKPCTIAIEACMGSHYWARTFQGFGHEVKMMSPQFVKPYIQSNKNDQNDARGIAEASTRPDMKFVPIKSLDQQDILLLHRARELSLKRRTAQANQIRGLLSEYGVVIAKSIDRIRELPRFLEQDADKLTPVAMEVFKGLHEQFKQYDQEVLGYEDRIKQLVKDDPRCQAILEIEGVGVLTASAAVATIGDANVFKNGREVAAWIGLVPRQHSSGNTVRLLGISKRGDRYLRTLLIQGARSVVQRCDKKTDQRNLWIQERKRRGGYNKAAVAVANKNARIIWAILKTGECYRPSTVSETT